MPPRVEKPEQRETQMRVLMLKLLTPLGTFLTFYRTRRFSPTLVLDSVSMKLYY